MQLLPLSFNLSCTVLLTVALTSCFNQATVDTSDLSIFNGVRTDDFPAVVKLIRHDNKKVCTGTFFTTEHLLTSAHCVADNQTGGLSIAGSGEQSLKAVGFNLADGLWPPSSLADSDQFGSPLDLAVVTFPKVEGRATLTFGRIQQGERVTMVGYGYTEGYEETESAGEKYMGTNFLTGETEFLLKIASKLDRQSGLAIVTPGDSGGPLLNDRGLLVGVTSGSRIIEQDTAGKVIKVEARFVKLASPTSERLIKTAQSSDAEHITATLPEDPGGIEVFLCGGSGGFDNDLFDRFNRNGGNGRTGRGGFFDDCQDDFGTGNQKFRLTADYGGGGQFNRFNGGKFGGGRFDDFFFGDDCFDDDNDDDDDDRDESNDEDDQDDRQDDDQSDDSSDKDDTNDNDNDTSKGSGDVTAAQVMASNKCSNAICHGSALPAVSSEQAAINRVNDANSPMPPSNSPSLSAAEKAAFQTYILTSGMLSGFATFNPFTGTVYNTLGAPLQGVAYDQQSAQVIDSDKSNVIRIDMKEQ